MEREGALFGVFDEENNENWLRFLSEITRSACQDLHCCPVVLYEFCMQHLTDSLKKEIDSTVLVNLQWEVACSYSITLNVYN